MSDRNAIDGAPDEKGFKSRQCIVTNLRLTAAGLQRRFYVFLELFKSLLCLNRYRCKENNERHRSSKKRIDTTLGELIEALSEVAFEHCKDAKEAYTLAGLVLADVLSNCVRSDLTPSPIKRRGFLECVYNNRYFN